MILLEIKCITFTISKSKMMNTVKIRINSYTGDIPLSIVLEKLCLLRKARKINDVETVNHFQLGKLKQFDVEFEKI